MLRDLLRGSTFSLLGVLLIAAASFFGFESLFSELDLSISSEALIAAFAALFIILPTSFLMERESENRLRGEKRSEIFRSNLSDYRKTASLMIEIIRAKTLSYETLSALRDHHAMLVILGSPKAIVSSREYLKECQKIMESSENSDDDKVDLTSEHELKLWPLVIDFLGASREGLELRGDDFKIADEQNAFGTLNEKQIVIENKFAPRKRVAASDWVVVNKISSQQKNIIDNLIAELKSENSSLEEKYTKSVISISSKNTSNPNGRVILYINGIDKKNITKLQFAASKNEQLIESAIDGLSAFNPKMVKRHDGVGVVLNVPSNKVNSSEMKIISSSIKMYEQDFKR